MLALIGDFILTDYQTGASIINPCQCRHACVPSHVCAVTCVCCHMCVHAVTRVCCHTCAVTRVCCQMCVLSHVCAVTRACRHTYVLSHVRAVTRVCCHTCVLSNVCAVTRACCHMRTVTFAQCTCPQSTVPSRVLFLFACIMVMCMVGLRVTCQGMLEDCLAVLAMLCTGPYFLFFCRYSKPCYVRDPISYSSAGTVEHTLYGALFPVLLQVQ